MMCMADRTYTHSPEVSRKSNRYYSDLKKKIFNGIFTQLDKSASGQISPENIDVDALEIKLVTIICPIFDEIYKKNLTLDKKEFFEKCMKLYDHLVPSQRNVILKHKKHHCHNMDPNEPTFTPELISRPSSTVNRLYRGESIGKRLQRLHNDRRERMFKAQEEKKEADMKYCTFYPSTNEQVYKKHELE